jgi:hypothetical protein
MFVRIHDVKALRIPSETLAQGERGGEESEVKDRAFSMGGMLP